MRITCDSCGANYAIADAKVLGRLVKVRCKSCGGTILVDGRDPSAVAASAQASAVPSVSGQPPPATAQPGLAGAAPGTASAVTSQGAGLLSAPPQGDDQTRVWAGSQAGAVAAADGWSVNLSDTDQRMMSTEQIIEGFLAGAVTDDAFVWKEGMDDWMPVLDVPELRAAIEQRHPSANQAPLPAFDLNSGPAAAPEPQSARMTSAVEHSADLFGNVEAAGSEAEAGAAPPPEPGPTVDERMIGARNENSVLFSLDALKAGVSLPGTAAAAGVAAARQPSKPAPGRSGRPKPPPPGKLGYRAASAPVEDILGLGSNNLEGQLFNPDANQALLTAPAPEPEPPKPKPKPVEAATSQSSAPAPARTGGPLLWIALAGVMAVLVAVALIGGLILGRTGAATEEVAVADQSDPSDTASDPSQTGAPQTNDPKQSDKQNQAQSGEARAAASQQTQPGTEAQASAKPQVTEEDRKRYEEARKKAEQEQKATAGKTDGKPATTKPTPGKKTDEKKSDEPTGTPFNKGAAIAALSSAASAASGCKRPNGPTGRGRVTVTFAPSGRVTSALVSGGGFGGTSVGGCIASVFRRSKVPPFDGSPVTVAKSFTIAE